MQVWSRSAVPSCEEPVSGLRLLALVAREGEELNQARAELLRSGDLLDETKNLLVPCDLTAPDQARGLIDSTVARFGRIDLLINNAGIIEVGPNSALDLP